MIPRTVWLGDNRFRFLNTTHQVNTPADWNRLEWGKLWLYNLHYFDMLRQPDLPDVVGNCWIARWIAENPPGIGNGWEPYTLSLRIVNWIKWQLSGHVLDSQALNSLAVQVRFLTQLVERHLLANHYLANAKALVFAGMFFSGMEAQQWLVDGCEIYREQLPEQILPDGGHFERSPMYHSIILEDLLDLVNIQSPLFLTDHITRMFRWLTVMTGPDGEIALFNDAANGIALAPSQLFNYAGKLGFEVPQPVVLSADLPSSGYARLVQGPWTLICDGAPVGPNYQPGHAHADTLSFELWYEKQRILVDSGTGEYVDTALRRKQRGTSGHNTLMLDGRNSSDVWGAHRVARRAGIVERKFDKDIFTAAHNGYAPAIHQRSWRFTAEQRIQITDHVAGRGRHEIELFWHCAPGCQVELKPGYAEITYAKQHFVLTLPPDGECHICTGNYSPEFGITLPVPVIHWQTAAELPFEHISEIGIIE